MWTTGQVLVLVNHIIQMKDFNLTALKGIFLNFSTSLITEQQL